MNADQAVVEIEGAAVAKLIASAKPNLYTDIEKYSKELKEVTDWLYINENTEDVKIASQLIINRNKNIRLSKELDELLATKDDLEFKGLEFHRKSGEVKVAEEIIVVLTALLNTLDNVDERYFFYIASKTAFKGELEAELSRNRVVIEHFDKFTLANSPFKK